MRELAGSLGRPVSGQKEDFTTEVAKDTEAEKRSGLRPGGVVRARVCGLG